MNRRFVALLLVLALGLQGPILAYAAVPSATGPGIATVSACPDGTLPRDGSECSSCCNHGSMPAGCISVLAVPMATPVLAIVDLTFSLNAAPPTSVAAPFAVQRPVPLIRPPIL